MKTILIPFRHSFLALSSFLFAIPLFAGEGTYRLLTTAGEATLDFSRKGAIVNFASVDRHIRISGEGSVPLFSMRFLNAADRKTVVEVSANDAAVFSPEIVRTNTLKLVYSKFPKIVKCVECDAFVRRGDNKFYFDITADIEPGWVLTEADYPSILLKAAPTATKQGFATWYDGEALFYTAAESKGVKTMKVVATPVEGGVRWCWRRFPGAQERYGQGFKTVMAAKVASSVEKVGMEDAQYIYDLWADPDKVTKGDPGAPKLLFLGNSITGTPPSLRWDGDWGMRASWRDRDYVHLVTKWLGRHWGKRPDMQFQNLAAWERNLATYDVNKRLADKIAYKPDYVFICLGENVPSIKTEEDQKLFEKKLTELATLFRRANGMKPTVVIRSPFWSRKWHREIQSKVAKATGAIYVDLNGIGDDKKLQAPGTTEDGGVAYHPGDDGMAVIAKAIVDAVTKAE